MTFNQEAASWAFPSQLSTSPVPSIGANAPSVSQLQLPTSDEKATILTFLRHCGCPFAEKTFLSFRAAASTHPSINFVAVSHSDQIATDKWLEAVGGADNVHVIVDSERELFARWGLGVSSFWHVLNPASMWNVYRLGKEHGIVSSFPSLLFPSSYPTRCGNASSLNRKLLTRGLQWNRPTESGSRWQTSGSFAVDRKGVVRWGGPAGRADFIPDFEEAVKAVME